MLNKLFINKILMYLLLFFFIYCPPFSFLPFNISLILSFFCIFLLYVKSFPRVLLYFKNELFLFSLICLYCLLVSFFSGVIVLYDPIIMLFFNIPLVFLIYYLLKSVYVVDIYSRFIDVLINLAIITSLISIFLWFNKDLNDFLKFSILKYNESLMLYQSHRGFGLADELLFSYSIVQACIFLLAVERYGLNLKNLFLFILVFFSISLNARIGYLFLAFFVFIPNVYKKSSLIWALCLFAFLSIFIFLFASTEFVIFSLEQLSYFSRDLISGKNDGVINVLLNEMLMFPSDPFSYLFGTGKNIFLGNEFSSDIGYVILFFYGGFFYLSLILMFFTYCLLQGLRTKNVIPIVIIIFMFVIANMKGLFFASKPGMHLFLCVYFIMLISYYESKFLKRIGSHH